MKTILTAALVVFAGQQASALSCNFGDAAAGYLQAVDHGGTFRAAVGTLEWSDDETETSNGVLVMDFEGQEFDLPARFVGEVLLPNRERVALDEMIQVRANCINGDCGYAYVSEPMLTYLHEINGETVMLAYPCQSYPAAPDAASIELVQACLDGDDCVWSYDY